LFNQKLFIKKRLFTLLSMFVMMTGMAMAQSNTTTTQNGNGNTASITQSN